MWGRLFTRIKQLNFMDFTELACQWLDLNPGLLPSQPITASDFKQLFSKANLSVTAWKKDCVSLEDNWVIEPIKDYIKYTTLISKYSTLLKSFNAETLSLYNLLTTQYERDLYATKVESPQEFKLMCKDLIEDAVYVLEYEIPYTLLMKVISSDIDAYLDLVDFDLLFKAIY